VEASHRRDPAARGRQGGPCSTSPARTWTASCWGAPRGGEEVREGALVASRCGCRRERDAAGLDRRRLSHPGPGDRRGRLPAPAATRASPLLGDRWPSHLVDLSSTRRPADTDVANIGKFVSRTQEGLNEPLGGPSRCWSRADGQRVAGAHVTFAVLGGGLLLDPIRHPRRQRDHGQANGGGPGPGSCSERHGRDPASPLESTPARWNRTSPPRSA
jgi:hypothetical protein